MKKKLFALQGNDSIFTSYLDTIKNIAYIEAVSKDKNNAKLFFNSPQEIHLFQKRKNQQRNN